MVERQSPSLDRTFAALAHPTRRAILKQLRGRELSVTQIAAAHLITFAAVAKHLDILEAAGVIRRRRVGREKRCSLLPGRLVAARTWIDDYAGFWERQVGALAAHVQGRRR